jgi:hypothetical protein
MSDRPREPDRAPGADHVTVVRVGHGANCSSIGSVVDTLFASATVGAAVFAAIVAALRTEKVVVTGPAPRDPQAKPPEKAP